MKKAAVFTYGVVAYLAFFVTFLYLIGFTGNILVPKSVDGPAAMPTAIAIAINVSLIALFGIQHTIMARAGFKRWWTQYIPKAAERSTFVLTTVAILVLMFWQWQPIEGTVWTIENEAMRAGMWTLFALGWATVLYASFLINHFDLFGLRQVTLYAMGREYTPLPLKVTALYRMVRNPLMTGFLIAMWATPDMTMSHLLFAGTYTAYILIGIQIEERSIMNELGESYRQYRAKTPMLIPNPMKGLTAPVKETAPTIVVATDK